MAPIQNDRNNIVYRLISRIKDKMSPNMLIGIDTDYEFFVKNSSSVTSTLNDIELIWNFSESIYEDDVSIVFELTTTVVRASSSDPYSSSTDSSNILNEFRSRWNSSWRLTPSADLRLLDPGGELRKRRSRGNRGACHASWSAADLGSR